MAKLYYDDNLSDHVKRVAREYLNVHGDNDLYISSSRGYHMYPGVLYFPEGEIKTKLTSEDSDKEVIMFRKLDYSDYRVVFRYAIPGERHYNEEAKRMEGPVLRIKDYWKMVEDFASTITFEN